MHTPPPTPGRLLYRAQPGADHVPTGPQVHTAQEAAAIALANGAAHARKRSTERAGLMTPRETPGKRAPRLFASQDANTAKILFSSGAGCEAQEAFRVFEDVRTPEALTETEDENPFAMPGRPKSLSHATKSSRRMSTSSDEDCRMNMSEGPYATPQGTRPPVDPLQFATPRDYEAVSDGSADRTDGLYYVVRGKRVFKPFASDADRHEHYQADAPPKLLFQAEIRQQQQSRARQANLVAGSVNGQAMH